MATQRVPVHQGVKGQVSRPSDPSQPTGSRPGPSDDGGGDDDDDDDDIYIMMKCMCVCLFVTFLLILSSPAKLLIYI